MFNLHKDFKEIDREVQRIRGFLIIHRTFESIEDKETQIHVFYNKFNGYWHSYISKGDLIVCSLNRSEITL